MDYLKYVAFAAENLQFYLWFKDYSARFEKLPETERPLSTEWTKAQAEEAANSSNRISRTIVPSKVAQMLKDTDFADGQPRSTFDKADPFVTPAKTPSLEEKRELSSEYASSSTDGKTQSSAEYRSNADHAFDEAGLKWKPREYPQ